MRIAYLTQSYPPIINGIAFAVQQIAESMVQRKHKILVIAASDRMSPYHTYKDNISILRLRSFNNPLRVGQSLIVHPRHLTIKALHQFQPDIIHVHELIPMGTIALIYMKYAPLPIIFTAHPLSSTGSLHLPKLLETFLETIYWIQARHILSKFTSVIAPTQAVASVIKQKTGVMADVISNGLDLEIPHSCELHETLYLQTINSITCIQ